MWCFCPEIWSLELDIVFVISSKFMKMNSLKIYLVFLRVEQKYLPS